MIKINEAQLEKDVRKYLKECKVSYDALSHNLSQLQSELNGKIQYKPMLLGSAEEVIARKAIPNENKGLVYLLEEHTDLRDLAIKNFQTCDKKLAGYHTRIAIIQNEIYKKAPEYKEKPVPDTALEASKPSAESYKSTEKNDFDKGFDNFLYNDETPKNDTPLFPLDKKTPFNKICDFLNIPHQSLTSDRDKYHFYSFLGDLRRDKDESLDNISLLEVDDIQPLLLERRSLKNIIHEYETLRFGCATEARKNDILSKKYQIEIKEKSHIVELIKDRLNGLEDVMTELNRRSLAYKSGNLTRIYESIKASLSRNHPDIFESCP
jgi:hypothetical protein